MRGRGCAGSCGSSLVLENLSKRWLPPVVWINPQTLRRSPGRYPQPFRARMTIDIAPNEPSPHGLLTALRLPAKWSRRVSTSPVPDSRVPKQRKIRDLPRGPDDALRPGLRLVAAGSRRLLRQDDIGDPPGAQHAAGWRTYSQRRVARANEKTCRGSCQPFVSSQQPCCRAVRVGLPWQGVVPRRPSSWVVGALYLAGVSRHPRPLATPALNDRLAAVPATDPAPVTGGSPTWAAGLSGSMLGRPPRCG